MRVRLVGRTEPPNSAPGLRSSPAPRGDAVSCGCDFFVRRSSSRAVVPTFRQTRRACAPSAAPPPSAGVAVPYAPLSRNPRRNIRIGNALLFTSGGAGDVVAQRSRFALDLLQAVHHHIADANNADEAPIRQYRQVAD